MRNLKSAGRYASQGLFPLEANCRASMHLPARWSGIGKSTFLKEESLEVAAFDIGQLKMWGPAEERCI